MESASSWYRLSSFKLKIIAMLTMTIDHLGYLLCSFLQYNNAAYQTGIIFRYIGRLAMPLFAFMIVEGVIHTKNYKKYAARLGIMAGIVTAALLLCFILSKCGIYANDLKSIYLEGNIFIDLLLGSFAVYALKSPNKKFKLLCLIPIAISFLSFAAKSAEINMNVEVYWYPAFLRLQYDFLSVILIMAFYLAKLLTKMYYHYQEQVTGVSDEIWKENGQYQKMENLTSAGALIIISSLYFAITFISPSTFKYYIDPYIQITMMASALFILLYNGLRGYNKKWFQIFSYLYYPLHLVVLGLIFVLIFGV